MGEDRTGGQRPGDQLSYEQARDQLVEIVQTLESGGAGLSESLALWERGEQLADICQAWLDGARSRIEAARDRRTPGEEQRPVSGR
ncbi:exodeoxyribonuclease VII small subunit [Raineyella fluvialis]|uniref:Exodeoxyribonuclease 7 small subunit n=1 Tax=Raineyella fluvialis TaxID=2662261 RepID=A0A5Q2FF44_9ACTN|nr:exodeoxyribonuclease VII small subunit [Raineyella fluvialis]QGF24114.1 exodeoxyribonuclease VII small subunit [Raineyella fluvialis]